MNRNIPLRTVNYIDNVFNLQQLKNTNKIENETVSKE